MLRTTRESRHEQQPCSLDGRVWIVADARVDGQSELCQKLRSAGHDCRQSTNDAELILLAYRAWGDDCVRHLLGDFAFAIWDGPRQRLFCARDHFGVKPFYYARAGNCVVFSNTLSCVREHPAVSDEPNDLTIADFLLFGINQDETTTAYAGIRRLAAGASPELVRGQRCEWIATGTCRLAVTCATVEHATTSTTSPST